MKQRSNQKIFQNKNNNYNKKTLHYKNKYYNYKINYNLQLQIILKYQMNHKVQNNNYKLKL